MENRNTENRYPEHRPYRSFFWPVLLIGVGIIWLLANLNIIETASLFGLWQLWPVLLILAGIDILFSRYVPALGLLLGLLTIAGVVVLLVAGPSLNLNLPASAEVQTEQFSEPLESAQSATLNLDISQFATTIHSIDGDSLVDASISHFGDFDFEVSGSDDKNIVMRNENTFRTGIFFPTANERWDIGLNSAVPWQFNIDGGSGSADIDLSDLQVQGLTADMGSGSSDFRLPASEDGYDADINSGSGSVELWLPAETRMNVEIDSGSGSVTIYVPQDAAVRFELADDGSGSLNLPGEFERTEVGSSDEDEGVWETTGFDPAQGVSIRLSQGSGSVTLRYQ